jgi:hypothetical protein
VWLPRPDGEISHGGLGAVQRVARPPLWRANSTIRLRLAA